MAFKTRGIIKDVAVVVIGIVVIWIGLQIAFGTSNPFYVVSSGSMVPALQVHDVIVVQGNDPFEDVEVGDIIVFDRPVGHDKVIVHRVASITDDNPFTVRTMGDANPASIPGTDFPITEEEYIGTVVYVLPQVGYITRIFATQVAGIPLNYIIIAIIVSIMVLKHMKTRQGASQRPHIAEPDNDDTTQHGLDAGPSRYNPKDTRIRPADGAPDDPAKPKADNAGRDTDTPSRSKQGPDAGSDTASGR